MRNLLAPQPVIIGIEGGPCGGKTTLTEQIVAEAESRGQPVYVLPEVATKHILKLHEQGFSIPELAANDREGYLAFQMAVLGDINQRLISAKKEFAGTDTLILSDRLSNRPYITGEEYEELCRRLGYGPNEVIQNHVDKVIYLPSVAKVAPELYGELQLTNTARYETLDQAIATCDRTLSSVAAHPELHIVADGQDFDAKMRRAKNLAFDNQNEYETKWRPADEVELVEWIKAKQKAGEVLNSIEIGQSYHRLPDGTTYRLRAGTGSDGQDFYHFTVKQRHEYGSREINRIITEQQYQTLADQPCQGWLFKKRFVVLDNWQVWHCDFIMDGDEGFWIVEAEVTCPEEIDNIQCPVAMVDANYFKTEDYASRNLPRR